MDCLTKYCSHLSRSQRMSYFGPSRDNYDTMLILRVVAPSSRPSLENLRVIWMNPDGVV